MLHLTMLILLVLLSVVYVYFVLNPYLRQYEVEAEKVRAVRATVAGLGGIRAAPGAK